MTSEPSRLLPAGSLVNDLYEIVARVAADETTVTYLARHRLKDIQVRLRILKAEFRQSATEFQSFMQEIQRHKSERRLLDYGILIEGLLPYAVYGADEAANDEANKTS